MQAEPAIGASPAQPQMSTPVRKGHPVLGFALLSRLRAVLGADVLAGGGEPRLVLAPDAWVDYEAAQEAMGIARRYGLRGFVRTLVGNLTAAAMEVGEWDVASREIAAATRCTLTSSASGASIADCGCQTRPPAAATSAARLPGAWPSSQTTRPGPATAIGPCRYSIAG